MGYNMGYLDGMYGNFDYEIVIDDVDKCGEQGIIWCTEIGVYDGDDRIPWPDSWPSWVTVFFLKNQGCKIVNRSATVGKTIEIYS